MLGSNMILILSSETEVELTIGPSNADPNWEARSRTHHCCHERRMPDDYDRNSSDRLLTPLFNVYCLPLTLHTILAYNTDKATYKLFYRRM